MSRPKGGSPRRKFDAYETPPHYARALLDVIGHPQGRICEPCVGKGQLLIALAPSRSVTNDLNPRRLAHYHLDATKRSTWRQLQTGRLIDWTITNPPFTHELAIFRLALEFSTNVAMLARLSFLEPTRERRPFWIRWAPLAEIIILPRYSFKRVNGRRQTDNMTCCWIIIRRDASLDLGRQFYVSRRRELKAISL